MSIIQLKEANCKNCYKCIRNCPLKAIKFSGDQARIIDTDCVLCGRCTLICPQNAKQIKSDLPEVKKMLKSGAKLCVSLAPSYVAAFPGARFSEVSAALKKLGFCTVEETAIGATMVTKEFARLTNENNMKNIITTCCPTVVTLIEKYYPELVPSLAPVISPATAHAKMMKNMYGNRVKVVFIGPCISKKYEAAQSAYINNVLMFDELKQWMEEENIKVDLPDPSPSELHGVKSRLYPVPGGIINNIPKDMRKNYKTTAVDGLERCIEILDSIRDNSISGYLLEMSACVGSCVQGPGLASINTPFLITKDTLINNAKKKTTTPIPITEDVKVDMSISYNHTRVRDGIPDEETINEILSKIGKTTPESMLNCGTCGYPTCRDKAIAVFQGKADLKMCLPYMREKAESMSNLIIEHTPNAIFMLDNELNILEYNHRAETMLGLSDMDYTGLPIEMILDSRDFIKVKETGVAIIDSQNNTRDGNLTVEHSIVTVPNGDILAIVRDVTGEQAGRREMEKMRKETIETAQKVIDKQMRVAQEIASLLGETTGETKAALTSLKKSIAQGDNL